MEKKRCIACHGSGRIMGGGMITVDCDQCDGKGKIEFHVTYEKIKKTKSYDDAIKKIRATNKNISEDDAKEIFKEELEKIEKEENRR